MRTFLSLTKRNVKIFFKDKGLVISSLITPIILLVLYVTFLARVYRLNFRSALPEGMVVSDSLINGTVAAQLFASLLAVSCVTVAFCCNLLMVQDKVNGPKKDFLVTPVSKATVAISYYVATFAATIIVAFIATAASFVYISTQGWFMSFGDVMLVLADVLVLTLFGTAFSSAVNVFLKTNGQASAAGTLVSSAYGFVCGAYMPISNFGSGLQKVLGFLPGTYGTALLKNHALAGVAKEMEKQGFPTEVVEGIMKSLDCSVDFFGHTASIGAMYAIVLLATTLLIGVYVLATLKQTKNR